MNTNQQNYHQIIRGIIRSQGRIINEIRGKLNGAPVTDEALSAALQDYLPSYSPEEIMEICAQLRQGVREGAEDFAAIEDDIYDSDAAEAGYLERALNQLPEEQRRNFLILANRVLGELQQHPLGAEEEAKLNRMPYGELYRRTLALMKRESGHRAGEIIHEIRENLEDAEIEHETQDGESQYDESDAALIAAAGMFAVSAQECGKYVAECKLGLPEARAISRQSGFLSRCKGPLRRAVMGYVVPAATAIISLAAFVGIGYGIELLAAGMIAALPVMPEILIIMSGIGICLGAGALLGCAGIIPMFGLMKAMELHFEVTDAKEQIEGEIYDADVNETRVEDESKPAVLQAPGAKQFDPLGIAAKPLQVEI